MVARRKLLMQIGYATNRAVLFRHTSYLYDECYQPPSRYKMLDVINGYQGKVKSIDDINDSSCSLIYFDFDYYWNHPQYKDHYQCWRPDGISYIEFCGAILDEFKLLPDYQEYVDSVRQRLSIDHETIGLHIRRGDKGIETGKHTFVSLDGYEREVRKASEKLGSKRVFISSDSEEAMGEMKNRLDGYDVFWDEDEKRYDNANWSMVKENPEMRRDETMTGAKIIDLFGSCGHVIGQENTQFAKLGGSLCCARTGNKDCMTLIEYGSEEVVKYGSRSSNS
tara:strand:- start:13674 stop:14513 length:840 start_codon:yes stop_codon:yes gene_type:complete